MHLKPLVVAVAVGFTSYFLAPGLKCEAADKAVNAKDSNAPAGKSGNKAVKETSSNDKSSKESPAPAAKPANDSFSVVQVGYDVRVVKSSEITALREKTEADFKIALKNFEEAKKAATKAKKKFNDTKPVKPVLKTLASALKSEADAKTRRDKEAVKTEAQKKKAREEASNK